MAALTNLGMRIQETFSESTRDIAFIGRSTNAELFDTGEDKVRKIRRQLDSSSEREILEGMKRLVALISKGRNVSEFFAQVVKNVGSPNLEIRKLVYIYLLRYADLEPDLALLSINTFQKDLSDSNPLIRAMALRVLSGIRVTMIASIVVIGIKKCASDLSPYVRKAAALAIPKVHNLDPSQLPSLMPILLGLLRDRSPLSIGAVAVAFNAVCPTRLDLLHQQYRRLCRILSDADEWGQVHLIDLLSRYARTMLPAPSESTDSLDPDIKLLLDSAEPLFQSRNPAVTMAVVRVFYYIGRPAERAKVITPLLSLMHRSSEVERVVLGNCLVIARDHPTLLHRYLSRFFVRADDLPPTKRVKVKLLSKLVTPDNVDTIISEFKDYTYDVDDDLVADSIQAIGRCARVIPEAHQRCLSVLMTMIRTNHETTVTNAILVLKYLYQYRLLTTSGLPPPPSTSKIISGLAGRLDTIQHPAARACVVWLVGQYCPVAAADAVSTVVPGMADWAPDVLRRVAKSFPTEVDLVRLQILTLAAKLLVISPSTTVIQHLARYVFTQARFDANYDVRDRGRTLCALLKGAPGAQDLDGAAEADANEAEETVDEDAWERRTKEKEAGSTGGVVLRVEQARVILFEGKGAVDDGKEVVIPGLETLGTIGIVVGKTLYGEFDRRFPDWPEQGTDSSLRDSPDDVLPQAPQPAQAFGSVGAPRAANAAPVVLTPTTTTPSSTLAGNGKTWTDLDAFYASEDSEEGEEGEESEEEEGEDKSDSDEEAGDGEEEDDGEEGGGRVQGSSEDESTVA